ncbi:TPA: NAD-dependent epimerase/dehydratase family protein, partial [Pseudomonas aeruginosa]|nr:NAD-dependent epimerase/dehydratase family protein [Pseudomonas aeruginosa]
MRVLITGANGFVGKNLAAHLAERNDVEVITFTRENSIESLPGILGSIDFVFHLAGVNRPENPEDFKSGNANLTKALCDAIRRTGRSIPLLYTSSTQAELQNKYGLSKRDAENYIRELSLDTGSPVYIFRLPNVFGKWSRPSYNSAVATFCYNIARDIPIQINDPTAQITLVYIDDVVKKFLAI